MILTKASVELEGIKSQAQGLDMLVRLEEAGRTCYKSEQNEDKAPYESAVAFIGNVLKRGHESVIEHEKMTARFICDRGVTHEIVRHRLASYSQESTRYCNYKGGVEFIIPCWMDIPEGEYSSRDTIDASILKDNGASEWFGACLNAEASYLSLLEMGWTPQQARSVLPNSLKTEIVMTANLREWRHFFNLRAIGTAGKPHPQMVEVAAVLLEKVKSVVPVIFDDIG